jgi:hypothetical protein
MMAANPLTDEEREQIERAKASDFSGLLTWHQDEKGSWVRLLDAALHAQVGYGG